MESFNTLAFVDRVEELRKKYRVPGLAIAIVENDKISSAAWGQASIDPPRECTPDTLFDIASASKSLTAASVALLVADENLPDVKWETPMSKILPEDFVMPTKEATDAITVEDMLTHRTGLSPCDDSYFGVNSKEPDNAKSITRNLRNLHMAAPLRTKFIYCNMMYTVATHLVEECSKLPFADYLEQKFFQPLGMESTNLQPARARARGLGDRIATGYMWDKKTEEFRGFPFEDTPEANGAGSIITSVNDYIKWVRAMMNQQDPITEDTYQGLIKGRIIMNPGHKDLAPFTSPGFIGAGWEVEYYRGYRIVQHDGGIPGVSTTHFFIPEAKFGACLFGNVEEFYTVQRIIMQEMIDEVLNIPADQRVDREKEFNDDDAKWANQRDNEKEEIRQALCPGIKESQPLGLPLTAFVGKYWNAGFKEMEVQIKDGGLLIDANDRSFPCTLTLEHVCDDIKFTVELTKPLGVLECYFRGEFVVEDGKAVKMGMQIEDALEQLIWFDRLPEA